MAFMMSTKMISIAKPNNLSFHSSHSNGKCSQIQRGGSVNRLRRRSHRLHIASAAVTANAQRQLDVGVEVFLSKENKVLMGRRRSAIGYGEFALPGGHLEFGESFEECAVREMKEETGLALDITKFEILTITNNVIYEPEPYHLISVIMRATLEDPNQEPINLELDKSDGWNWYDWNHLPTPLIITLRNAISHGLNPFKPS